MTEEDSIKVQWSPRVKINQKAETATEDAFVASDGLKIETHHDGSLVGTGEGKYIQVWVYPDTINALREYFQHERDKELGRWRDPENPDMVVYPEGGTRGITVFNEKILGKIYYYDYDEPERLSGPFAATARRYYGARPRPWEDAQDGELWELEYHDTTIGALAVVNTSGRWFETPVGTLPADSRSIPHATRIWPKED